MWNCRRLLNSLMMWAGAPFRSCRLSLLLDLMISASLWVRSSSDLQGEQAWLCCGASLAAGWLPLAVCC